MLFDELLSLIYRQFMDLIDGMRAFSQVVATGSFTKAGDKLGISKKLVSKYIGQLEDRLGVRLLNRTTRSLSLTEAGTLYHDRCTRLLDDLDELERSLQSNIASPKGRLYISAPVTFGEMYIVGLISEFQSLYPEVTIDLQLSDRVINLVDEGFDVAVRIGQLENSSLMAKKLAPAEIVICASSEYLEKNGHPSHPSELAEHNIIADTNFRHSKNWPFKIDGEITHIPVSPSISVNSARSARDLAMQGNGITLCPKFVVQEELASGRLVELFRDNQTPESSIFAVYHNSRNLVPKVRVFVDFLVDTLQNELKN